MNHENLRSYWAKDTFFKNAVIRWDFFQVKQNLPVFLGSFRDTCVNNHKTVYVPTKFLVLHTFYMNVSLELNLRDFPSLSCRHTRVILLPQSKTLGINFRFSLQKKVKSRHTSQVAHQAGDYPGFRSMNRPGVFLLPLVGMLVHRRVTPSTVRVRCLAKNATRCSRPGIRRRAHYPEGHCTSLVLVCIILCYVNAFLLYLFQGHQSHPQGLVCTGQHCSNITAASWTDSKKLIKITSRLKSKLINLFKTIIILLVKKTMKQLERRLADLYIVSNYNL